MNMDKVVELYAALKEVVDAAFGGNGWDDVDPLFERQKNALKDIEKEIVMHIRTKMMKGVSQ